MDSEPKAKPLTLDEMTWEQRFYAALDALFEMEREKVLLEMRMAASPVAYWKESNRGLHKMARKLRKQR